MADYQNLDIGRVMQTAEAIKGMRREGENDRIRNLYMGEQVEQMRSSRYKAADQAKIDAINADWKSVASAAASVEAAANPKAFAEQNFPQFIQQWDGEHGQGAWAELDDNTVRQLASGYKAHAMSRLGEMPAAQKNEAYTLGPGQKRFGANGEVISEVAPNPRGNGISLTTPDGTEVQIGGDGVPNYGGSPMSKPTRTKLEEVFTNSQANAYALREQLSKYRPEFSTVGGKLKAGVAAAKEQVGMENAPQQQQFLSDFTSWKADTARLLSSYLNQLSGAAISPAEETRLKAGFPNSDDGPTQYQAKAQSTMRSFALAQARAAYLLSNPAQSLDSVSLDGMSHIITDEANRLAAALKTGGMDEARAKQEAIAKTRARYGMGQ